jgi:hypothetical protein
MEKMSHLVAYDAYRDNFNKADGIGWRARFGSRNGKERRGHLATLDCLVLMMYLYSR